MSVPALLDQLGSRHDGARTAQDMVRSALDGDRAGVRVLADAGQRIGAAVAIICNLVNPDRVIIGGELSAAYDILVPSLRTALERDALPFASAQVTVCRGQLGDRAVALGSVAAVLHSTSGFLRRSRPDGPGAEQNAAMR
ncbi:ROK family protein [Kutzneria chonburiensis]|uniref:ROK family protein n=1 Tax=Kutzneria chonburiensis TaxID=1483604 RepID=UPI00235F2580|nr:ROK family protein [Kutzneria chonburiensis]